MILLKSTNLEHMYYVNALFCIFFSQADKKSTKSKKQGKKQKKEGHKEDSGFQSEKGSKNSYHHESEYGKKEKIKII